MGKTHLISCDIAEFSIGGVDIVGHYTELSMSYEGERPKTISTKFYSTDLGNSLGRYNGRIAKVVVRLKSGDEPFIHGEYRVDHEVVVDGYGPIVEVVELTRHRVGKVVGDFMIWDEGDGTKTVKPILR